jgi:hypothetical protein
MLISPSLAQDMARAFLEPAEVPATLRVVFDQILQEKSAESRQFVKQFGNALGNQAALNLSERLLMGWTPERPVNPAQREQQFGEVSVHLARALASLDGVDLAHALTQVQAQLVKVHPFLRAADGAAHFNERARTILTTACAAHRTNLMPLSDSARQQLTDSFEAAVDGGQRLQVAMDEVKGMPLRVVRRRQP